MARPWADHRDAELRRRSAIRLAQAILGAAEDLADSHLKGALSLAIWMYTEADGKTNTRYRSRAAIGAPASMINHEHVITRKSLIAEMVSAPDRVEEILRKAVACTVLRDEHQALATVEKANPDLTGWARYEAAGIEVVDLATGNVIVSADLRQ